MDGKFTRKPRFFFSVRVTHPPVSITYSRVFPIDNVRISFTLDALNDIDIWACSIANAYLNAKYREKIWTKACTKFGNDKRKVMIVIRDLRASRRAMLVDTLLDLGYKPSREDMDFWMNPETKP